MTASHREINEAVLEPHDLPMAFSNRAQPAVICELNKQLPAGSDPPLPPP